jgi:ABC-2 type transport system permease protein
MMQTAQQEMTELPKCILRNYGILQYLDWFDFIGGYFLYTVPFASAADNQTDSQQFLLPIIMPLMLSVGFTVINDPHDNCSRFLHDSAYSPYRNADANSVYVPLWQIAISVTLLFVALCRLVCCKVYRIGILMYGKKPTEWDVSLVEILNKAGSVKT